MVSTGLPSVTPPQVDGQALEEISDEIDDFNRKRTDAKKENGMSDASKFDAQKDKKKFRRYQDASPKVKNFYTVQHAKQDVEYNRKVREYHQNRPKVGMTIWDAMVKLNDFVDESDPDTELSQIQHLLQTAEAMRRDDKPRWMQLTGLIHDLGKLLQFFGAEGQWDIVGDTFPVGCAFDKLNVSADTFKANPDYDHEIYSTKYGIYTPKCGLDNLMMSWGHDEYLYQVVKDQSTLPPEALYMIRYHSFYPWHLEGAYHEFMNKEDDAKLKAVKAFNPYDLYSKDDGVPDVEALKVRNATCLRPFFLANHDCLALLYEAHRRVLPKQDHQLVKEIRFFCPGWLHKWRITALGPMIPR